MSWHIFEVRSRYVKHHTADGGLNDTGAATPEQLINEKHRLEDVIVKLNIDLKNKNEKILELIEQIEDLKV